MVFKKLCACVLRTKSALALEGLVAELFGQWKSILLEDLELEQYLDCSTEWISPSYTTFGFVVQENRFSPCNPGNLPNKNVLFWCNRDKIVQLFSGQVDFLQVKTSYFLPNMASKNPQKCVGPYIEMLH